jgi:hypothetical protein
MLQGQREAQGGTQKRKEKDIKVYKKMDPRDKSD